MPPCSSHTHTQPRAQAVVEFGRVKGCWLKWPKLRWIPVPLELSLKALSFLWVKQRSNERQLLGPSLVSWNLMDHERQDVHATLDAAKDHAFKLLAGDYKCLFLLTHTLSTYQIRNFRSHFHCFLSARLRFRHGIDWLIDSFNEQ